MLDRDTLLVAGGAALMAGAALVAKLAYLHGVTASTMVLGRYLVAAGIFIAFLRFRGMAVAPPRGALWAGMAGGALSAFLTIGYITSVQLIPVSLAVLVFYLFPVWTVLLGHALGMERLTGAKLAVVLLSVTGIALTVGPEFTRVNAAGIALAVGGGMSLAVMATVGKPWTQLTGPVRVSLYAALHGMWGAVAIGPWVGYPAWPPDTFSALAIAGSGVLFAIGYLALLVGIGRAAASRVAVAASLEPVVTVLLSVMLLNEPLTWIKAAGGGLVVVAAAVLPLLSGEPERRAPASRAGA